MFLRKRRERQSVGVSEYQDTPSNIHEISRNLLIQITHCSVTEICSFIKKDSLVKISKNVVGISWLHSSQ